MLSAHEEQDDDIKECPNIDIEDDGILLILQQYYVTGFRSSGRNGGFEQFKDLRTIFSDNDYKNGLDNNDRYLDAISKGNVKLAINLIESSVNALYIKWGPHFGTAHALHYILRNLEYIKSKESKHYPKYKELVQFIKEYILPNMSSNYINTKYFRGGDVLNRGTRVSIMDMIIAVNDIDLLKLMVNHCKDMIHFDDKTSYFGGMAYGSSESSFLLDCIGPKIDSEIFEYLLTEQHITINVNEYFNKFIGGHTTKYTILHKIIKNNHIKCFKQLMVCCKNVVNINVFHETVNRKSVKKSGSSEYNFISEKITETSLHIAIKNNCEYLIKLLIINGIDVNIEYLIRIGNNYEASDLFVEKERIDVFSFIHKIKDKTIEIDENIYDKFNATNITNIIKQRYFPDMIDEYPSNIQQSIEIILFYFPNIGKIMLQYFL